MNLHFLLFSSCLDTPCWYRHWFISLQSDCTMHSNWWWNIVKFACFGLLMTLQSNPRLALHLTTGKNNYSNRQVSKKHSVNCDFVRTAFTLRSINYHPAMGWKKNTIKDVMSVHSVMVMCIYSGLECSTKCDWKKYQLSSKWKTIIGLSKHFITN